MPPKEIEPRLWTRHQEHMQPRVDVLHPQVVALKQAMEDGKKWDLVTKGAGDENYYTRDYPFNYKVAEDSRQKRYFATEAHLDGQSDTLKFAVYEYKADDQRESIAKDFYQANTNGTIIDIASMASVDPADDSYRSVKKALEVITLKLRDEATLARRRQELARKHRKRVIGTLAASAGGVVLVGGLVYTGIQNFIVLPSEAAEAQRQTYDDTSPQLPGEGVTIDFNSFETMPISEFNAVPTYGGSDTSYESPRLAEITAANESCVTLPGDFNEGDIVRVALPEKSQYTGYHYGTTIRDDQVSICLVEDLLDDDSTETLKITVQIK